MGDIKRTCRERGIALARDIHRACVIPGIGVICKMQEDLSAPYPGYGLGAMDAYNGYVSYLLLDEKVHAPEIAEMRTLIDQTWRELTIEQDLGLGVMLRLAHYFPEEASKAQTQHSLQTLDEMWLKPPGHFCRAPWLRESKFAFTNIPLSRALCLAPWFPQIKKSPQSAFQRNIAPFSDGGRGTGWE